MTIRRPAFASAALALAAGLAVATMVPAPARADWTPETAYVRDCINAASRAHRVPAVLLVMLLRVEGGRLGAVSQNTNDTVDIGPMQVNSIWVHKVAQRWGATDQAAYQAMRDSLCANLEAGAWILRTGLDEAQGDLWQGVAFYHSHSPEHQQRYLKLLWQEASRLGLLTRTPSGNAAPVAAASAAPAPGVPPSSKPISGKPDRQPPPPIAIIEASR